MRRRRRSSSSLPLMAGLVLLVLIMLFSLRSCGGGAASAGSPEDAIEEFYEAEQEADFGRAWDLFHSEMKKRFKKSAYIQTKNHVFLGHMEVETFQVDIGEMKKLKEWQMSKEGPVFNDVTAAEVTMTYNSQFGVLEIGQKSYAVLEKGEWKVLWDYNY
ncbi:hypothetical protein FZC84_19590 [Rossellomorea vietnamensis]|uniref:Uncharacterized protein n=1 Tax=Rossellomorea vietnamensis TaxID=218284 RepID=A0A5D4M6L1_9BACI|nr:hypothetical protein [Rossellomorea vietnamensis]TYR97023.1 hypothetical protein FZC84_19590 [Rossellomorea vietnamensis]